MHLLIAVASKHGSTQGIGAAIADELRAAGLDATLADITTVSSIDDYDAVIIGSAVYMGNWMSEARQFVETHASELSAKPVWLFSSGPIGSDTEGAEPPRVTDLAERLGARDHVVFAGRLERDDLSLGERLVTRVVKAPEGDYRDWDAIRTWAKGIAAVLVPQPA
jgi:menaquinone-dependent protoporphyrinogen oxidase